MTDYKSAIAALIPYDEITEQDVAPTQDAAFGDWCLPCFKLAKVLRNAPPRIAAELAEKIEKPVWLDKVEAVGGYLNFYLDKAAFAAEVVRDYADAVPLARVGAGKTICMDYSSINIAKPFHMGHLPSTALGGSLARIFTALGYRVVSINHLGDYGTQFGKLIASFRRNGTLEGVRAGGVRELQRIYVKYSDLEEADPSIIEEARGWSLKIEQGDPEAVELFETFKEITLEEVRRIYDLLGIRFDSYNGEAFFVKRVAPVVAELEEKGLLVESEGARVVDLEEYGMPPCLILRSDGASLYATRDIAAALYRKQEYDFDKCLYIVAYQQNLHFKQWFKVIDLMGYEWAKDLEHVAFGMVGLEGGNFSSRKGNVVYLSDVLDSAVAEAKRIMTEKSDRLDDLDAAARSVGVGAVIYSALSSAKIKDVTFSLEKVLSFEGETGPYLQYTHARCCSVLAKAGEVCIPASCEALTDAESNALATAIAKLPAAVADAAEKREPCIVSKQLIAIASAYNKFYFEHKILTDDPTVTACRVALTRATKNALAFGLNLILLDAVEAM